MDDKTTLEDLLKLELHKYEEEVKNTVDKAVKEVAMEKTLKELSNTWASMEFEKDFHERTKLNVLKISEETIEILEENQVGIILVKIIAEKEKPIISAIMINVKSAYIGAVTKHVGIKVCWIFRG